MSYNGSGTFNINSAGQPVVTGTVISSTAFNALTADLGTGLSTALTKDGQTVATARIPFAAGINSSLVTDATNTTTGSIITAGGVGIAKAVFVGTTLNVAGASTLAGITGSFNGTVGATTPAAGSFTTLSATGTLSGGTSGTGYSFSGSAPATSLTLDASGQLGIGEATPTQKVHAKTASTTYYLAETTGTSASAGFRMKAGASADYTLFTTQGVNQFAIYDNAASSQRVTLDSSGNFLVGTTTAAGKLTVKASGTENVGNQIANFTSATSGDGVFFFLSNGTAHGNASLPTIAVNRNTSTARSINAEGTINASGADYAEYMTKASNFIVAKGDVVGIDAQGKLTNVFVNAVSFVVKSTDPSYVGGDSWGSVDAIGKRPDVDATQAEKDAFETVLEVARQRVDRIAFAGQVPVNVLGATAGQYIVPVDDNGAIKGKAVSNPTFEQYQISVGKVIAIESDGRAKIIVKVA